MAGENAFFTALKTGEILLFWMGKQLLPPGNLFMAIASINPTTGETLQTFTPHSDADIEDKLAAAQTAFERYRRTSLDRRAQWMRAAADLLESDSGKFARLMALEMGKPIQAAVGEIKKCAWVCRYYADEAPNFLTDVSIDTDARHSFVRYQPLGAILAVMPWNFPFWQVFRFAAPALMAGNVAVLKHASNVPQCAVTIEKIFQEVGMPAGVFQTLLVESDRVEKIVADSRIQAATLTGSEAAGSSLAATAGKHIKKTVLELGGSDPFIIMSSADLDKAIETGIQARMLNNGQSCIAAKRFLVADACADEFQQKFLEKFQTIQMGDPLLEDTQLGPLATPQILQDLHWQVRESVEKGAKILCGGSPPNDSQGNFYPPTILTDIPIDSPAYREEFFGPVALFFHIPDIDTAIAVANSSPYGLGASVWTQEETEIERFINELSSGSVFVNGMVKSDPRLPFGGVKLSGYGRELGREGIWEFVNIKTVWIGE
jgi:succinate-semialdehyde dehydrogenase/glutarate-semialdehyde dehydrogenase